MAAEEEEAAAPPQKRFYRQRAHSNPLADHTLSYPSRPQDMDWAALFPSFFPPDAAPGTAPARVEFVDVGCGYGGLLVALAERFPQTLALGLELRGKVAAFTRARLRALRAARPGAYGNVACVRANAMKHLPHFFRRAQGLVYTVTDVPELHQWMLRHFGEHPLFEALPPPQLAAEPLLPLLPSVTEEGQRARRAGRAPNSAVFRRRPDPPAAAP
ncbi:tRNA (guanine-N(7)-)-methyltransferase isoform X2 [Taeniopygia guttata]|uniref:tRNA (guanine-N(7)-)-methyltransferase isoform X2 n=1 Tax=Taeniopygia guttata TaxID=59729 RepID=UPI003BB86843